MDLYFITFAVMAVGAGIFTITAREALASALGLLTVFVACAALYLHLHAPLIAIFQISIYAGAILVLVVFVIMLLMSPDDRLEIVQENMAYRIMGVVLAASMMGILAVALKDVREQAAKALPAGFGSPGEIGMLFFKDYLLHFEVASVLLLVALIAAIYLGKKKL